MTVHVSLTIFQISKLLTIKIQALQPIHIQDHFTTTSQRLHNDATTTIQPPYNHFKSTSSPPQVHFKSTSSPPQVHFKSSTQPSQKHYTSTSQPPHHIDHFTSTTTDICKMLFHNSLLLVLSAVAMLRPASGAPLQLSANSNMMLPRSTITTTIDTTISSTTTVTTITISGTTTTTTMSSGTTTTTTTIPQVPTVHVETQAPAASVLSAALKTFSPLYARAVHATSSPLPWSYSWDSDITTQLPAASVLSEALGLPTLTTSVSSTTSIPSKTTAPSTTTPAPKEPTTTSEPEKPKPAPTTEEPKPSPTHEEPPPPPPGPTAACYYYDNVFYTVIEITPIGGFSPDGKSFHKQVNKCGAVTTFEFGEWDNGTHWALFDIDNTFVHGCIEKAIHLSGGPNDFKCIQQGMFNGTFVLPPGYAQPKAADAFGY